MERKVSLRYAIVGLPGSGKSTFATKLSRLTSIPVYHLDKSQFVAGGAKRDKKEFLLLQQKMINEESWIIEGCSMSTLESRFAQADCVIYFHFPRFLCLWRLFKRQFIYDKEVSETGCARAVNWILLRYMWNFNREKGKAIAELRSKYPQVDFRVFRNSQDADHYLEKVKRDFL